MKALEGVVVVKEGFLEEVSLKLNPTGQTGVVRQREKGQRCRDQTWLVQRTLRTATARNGTRRLRGVQGWIQNVPYATPSSLEFLLQVVGTTVYKGESVTMHSTPQLQAFNPREKGGEGRSGKRS